MNQLRHERERRGWTLDDIADRTRIPRQYLEALEDGNHEILPPGPFFRGYLRQYLEFLGQDTEVKPDAETETGEQALDAQIDAQVAEAMNTALEAREEVPLFRLVIAGFMLTLAVVLILQVSDRIASPEVGADGVTVAAGPPHKVRIYAVDDVRVKVVTDGADAFSGTINGTQTLEFEATDKLEIEIGDLTRALVHYNGERIEPLGNLSRGRRLVFIHESRE